MLYCGMAAHHGDQVAAVVVAPGPGSGATQPHGHSQQGHGAAGEARKAADDVKQKLPDAAHKCGVCASCCHSVAIAEFPQTVVFAPLAQAELHEPFVLIYSLPTLVPERPPRG